MRNPRTRFKLKPSDLKTRKRRGRGTQLIEKNNQKYLWVPPIGWRRKDNRGGWVTHSVVGTMSRRELGELWT